MLALSPFRKDALLDSKKYIGMDAARKAFRLAVRNDAGKIVMECVV